MVEVHAFASSRARHPVRSDARAVAERIIGELFGWDFADAVPAHDRGAPCILPQLLPRYLNGDPCALEFPELAPCPEVDASLDRLVAIARSEFEGLVDSHERAWLHELEVRTCILARIHADPELSRRARVLRRIAALAEVELEQQHSERLWLRLRSAAPLPGPAPDSRARMQRLLTHVSSFPYVGNYAHLVRAELALLRAEVPRATPQLRAAHARALKIPAHERTIAVCGCGPLPLSGLMLHASTGAPVTLVDVDPRSAERAAALVAELERIRVLERGAVEVVVGDAAEPAAWQREHDVVLVASLVPEAAKLQLARALPAFAVRKSVAVVFRSAAGLSAELAYEPIPTAQIASPRLPFCGESVPEHVLASMNREVLVVAHSSVLNTSELYRSLPEGIGTGA